MWSPQAYAYPPSVTNTNNNNKDYNFIKINNLNNNNMGVTHLSYLCCPKASLPKSNNKETKLTNSSKPRYQIFFLVIRFFVFSFKSLDFWD